MAKTTTKIAIPCRRPCRRRFLADSAAGLSGIALAALLSDAEHLAADDEPHIRPDIDPLNPFVPRAPHFDPQVKNVVVVHCSGAISHVDTFDYKPELVRHDGQPLPGNEKLVSFQGDNGNLVRPLWKFRPRGESGKMVSDLVPNTGDMSDSICYLHSLTTKSNTHGPAENLMTTGFALLIGNLISADRSEPTRRK